jgi:hypothetical protein
VGIAASSCRFSSPSCRPLRRLGVGGRDVRRLSLTRRQQWFPMRRHEEEKPRGRGSGSGKRRRGAGGAAEESARERLKLHRTEMAGWLRIPKMWWRGARGGCSRTGSTAPSSIACSPPPRGCSLPATRSARRRERDHTPTGGLAWLHGAPAPGAQRLLVVVECFCFSLLLQ